MADRDFGLIRFDRARAELAKISSVSEVKEIRDKATALRLYVKQQGAGLEMQNQCAEIKLRAERRAGELLAETPLNEGTRLGGNTMLPPDESPRLADLGVSRMQSHRWQRIAKLPEPEFEDFIDTTKSAGHELTSVGMAARAKVWLNAGRKASIEKPTPAQSVQTLAELADAGKRFGTIYADPPWKYGNQGTRAATDNHYPTMTVEEVCALPIEGLAAENAHLHLWTTNAFLRPAFDVITAWGFTYKSCFIWAKPQMGIGNYWRVSHEFLLLGVRGSCPFADHSLMSWASIPRTEHSAKPEAVRAMIEKASPAPRLELFARTTARGWTSWGNEVQRQLFDGG